ncbi:MAG: hypothetical protein K6D95_06200 [Treponema sp.]|nr:hypothetical protein [Treponema sp.]
MKKILCLCLSSTIQRTVTFENLLLENVNRSKSYVEHASGKAINSARVLNQLQKGCVKSICPLGEENYNHFLNLAKNDDLSIDYVLIPGSTRSCWTLLNSSNHTTTELVVGEPAEEKQDKAEVKFLKLFYENLMEADAVLLAGSRPAIWSEDLYATISGMTKDNNKFLLADFTGKDLLTTLKTAIPDVIKINDEEFCQTFACGMEEAGLKEALIQKSKDLNNIIVVTRGKDSTLAAKKGDLFECECEKILPVNTTACGDSFNAGFLFEYLQNEDFEAAIKKGNWAAARNAMSVIPGSIQ